MDYNEAWIQKQEIGDEKAFKFLGSALHVNKRTREDHAKP